MRVAPRHESRLSSKEQIKLSLKESFKSFKESLPDLTSHSSSRQEFNELEYSFEPHQKYSKAVYPMMEMLGINRDIFIKEYLVESTICEAMNRIWIVVFKVGWELRDEYSGERMQLLSYFRVIKTLDEFRHFQVYMDSKYSVPVLKQKDFTADGMIKYLQKLVAVGANQDIRADVTFLSFIGVIGEVSKFGVDHHVQRVHLKQKIFKNERVYFESEAHHHNEHSCSHSLFNFLCCNHEPQKKYWIKMNSESLGLYRDKVASHLKIKEILVFTKEVQMKFNVEAASEKFTMRVTNGMNSIMVSLENFVQLALFAVSLNLCLEDSHYLNKNKYVSFAIKREQCISNYYADGEGYFGDLYKALVSAKREICITDWMLTPYFLLKRPDGLETGPSRLDKVLIEAAEERKVKVFILVFCEPVMMPLDSEHVEQHFSEYENIHVLRHPNLIIPIMWSHHEKMVIIDETIGFMGGFDICWGRWDNHDHDVTNEKGLWEGADYNNARIADVTEPRLYKQTNLNYDEHPRMPWHDIGLKVVGKSVIDLKRHFTQYWYFALKDLSRPNANKINTEMYKLTETAAQMHLKRVESRHAAIQKKQLEEKELRRKESSRSSRIRDKLKLHKNQSNKFFSKEEEKTIYETMLKKTESQLDRKFKEDNPSKLRVKFLRSFSSYRQLQIKGLYNQKEAERHILPNQRKISHQMLRSSSKWSLGIEGKVEQSIHLGYLELIRHSKEFIYIENQFFMGIEHKIIDALIERIERAYEQKENFRVCVMIPLLPGFPGEVDSNEAAVVKIQLHWQYHAICRSPESIFQRLQHIENLEKYIFFFGLRNHGVIGPQNKPITEIIYIHSKLMIVDDKYALIGSANINDRSQIGTRDSEIAMISEDETNHGQIARFRKKLFMEHWDMSAEEAEMFAHTQVEKRVRVWDLMVGRARQNTEVYRQIFHCYPDDTFACYQQVTDFKNHQVDKQFYQNQKAKIKGHAVVNPMNFLSAERLTFSPLQLEYYAPEKAFT